MAKRTETRSQGVVENPAAEPTQPAAGGRPAAMRLRAGPNASDGTFALRVSDDVRLEIRRDEEVEVPATLEYEAVCNVRGPDFGKRFKKSVDVAWLLSKALQFGLVEWTNRPPPQPRKSRRRR